MISTEIIQGDIVDMKGQFTGSVELVYVDPPFFTQRKHGDSFDDRWDDIEHYVNEVTWRITHGWDALKPGGTLLVHLDWHAVHYVKVKLDLMAWNGEFQNEIIWKYNSGGASKKRLARKHDTILVYTKNGANPTFNPIREPYPHDYGDRPGFHPDGKLLSDVWTDISFLGTSSKERTGYPTQKPVALLERLVYLYSNPGDTVLDFYCGSGTTGVAARNLGRNAILIDKNPDAIEVAASRLAPKA